jgi:hypothetical protein
MMRDFMQSLTTSKLDELRHWWAAVNLNGLNIPTINPNYIISHTARKSGLDGCIQVFIGCGYPIQTWARATE